MNNHCFDSIQPYTLVVVDMQPGWNAACDEETLLAVLEEVGLAGSRRMPVVILETNPERNGSTFKPILDLLATFDSELWVIQEKCYHYDRPFSPSDGAAEVAEACEVLEYTTGRFRLCGVNSDVCVFLTAMGLGKDFFPEARLEVVKRACNTQWDGGKPSQWESWMRYERWHDWRGACLVD